MSYATGSKLGNKQKWVKKAEEEQEYYAGEVEGEQETRSQASEANVNLAVKVQSLEDSVSKIQLMQDMYRGLLDMQNEVD